MKTLYESVLDVFSDNSEYEDDTYKMELQDGYFLLINNDYDYKMLRDLMSDSIRNRGVHTNNEYKDINGVPYRLQYDKYRDVFIVNGIDVDTDIMSNFLNSYYDN